MAVESALHLIRQCGRRHCLLHLPALTAPSLRPSFLPASSFGLSSLLPPFLPLLVRRAQVPLNSTLCAAVSSTHFALALVIADPPIVRLYHVPTLQRSASARSQCKVQCKQTLHLTTVFWNQSTSSVSK